MRPESFIALRYLRARHSYGFISFIGYLGMIGLAIGVAALILTLSAMRGFEAEVEKKVSGIDGHLRLASALGDKGTLPDSVLAYLTNHSEIQDTSLIFHGLALDKAIDHKVIIKRFYSALVRIGITDIQRIERNITFHSWRHFFNSYMRTRIPDNQLRKITGHRTIAMTEHYDHQYEEELDQARFYQDKILLPIN